MRGLLSGSLGHGFIVIIVVVFIVVFVVVFVVVVVVIIVVVVVVVVIQVVVVIVIVVVVFVVFVVTVLFFGVHGIVSWLLCIWWDDHESLAWHVWSVGCCVGWFSGWESQECCGFIGQCEVFFG